MSIRLVKAWTRDCLFWCCGAGAAPCWTLVWLQIFFRYCVEWKQYHYCNMWMNRGMLISSQATSIACHKCCPIQEYERVGPACNANYQISFPQKSISWVFLLFRYLHNILRREKVIILATTSLVQIYILDYKTGSPWYLEINHKLKNSLKY